MIEINGKQYYGVIYKIENNITHCCYIGQTTHPKGFNGRYYHKGVGIERVYNWLKSQRKRGARYNKYLLRSIEKCGLEAFTVDEVFDTAMTMEELNKKESYYIEKFDSYNNGYNMSFGGDSMSGMKRPKGKDCKNSKSVYQLDLNGNLIKVWDSATDAYNSIGVCQATISNVCNGKSKTAGNFIWVFENDYDPNKDYKRIPRIKDCGKGTKPVLLLSDDNEIVEEFYSVIFAARQLKISPQDVSGICTHQIKNGKYNLIFKNEYMGEQRLSVEGIA